MISQIRPPAADAKMESRVRVREHREAILTVQLRLNESLVAMGRRLLVVRKMLGREKFASWVRRHLRWTPTEARHLITMAGRFNRPERDRVDPPAMLLLGDPNVPRRVALRALRYVRGGRRRRVTLTMATRLIEAERQAALAAASADDASAPLESPECS